MSTGSEDKGGQSKLCLTCREGTDITKDHAKAKAKATDATEATSKAKATDVTDVTGVKDATEAADSTGEVTEWSKRQGNYSYLPKMITCDERYNLQERDTLVSETPKIGRCPLKVPLTGLPNDVWVFYWASTTSSDPLKIQGQEEVYEGDINHGLLTTSAQGTLQLTLNCPQPYKVKGTTYSRHVHYIVEQKEEGIWSSMKTMRITCPISRDDLETTLQDKLALVIFSLPGEYFEDDHIPGTLNLPRETLDSLTSKEKERHITEFIQDNVKGYPEIKRRLQAKELEIHDVPIVTYCMNDTCKSSGRLLEHLYESGFHNVKEYTPGLKGWRKKVSSLDIPKTEEIEEKETEEPKEPKETKENEKETQDEIGTPEYTEEPVEFEGVGYIVDTNSKKNNLLNENFEVIGTCTYDPTGGKILQVTEWTSDEAKQDHKSLRIPDETPQEETPSIPEPEADNDSSDSSESEDMVAYDKLYSYSASDLKALKKPELVSLASQVSCREPGTYSLPTKTRAPTELIKTILECQGKTKGTGPARNKDFLGLTVPELKGKIRGLAQREPGTFKVPLTAKNKTELVEYIMNCRGRPRQMAGSGRVSKELNPKELNPKVRKKPANMWGYH
jgi:rhodanese-related sulfurtransferase